MRVIETRPHSRQQFRNSKRGVKQKTIMLQFLIEAVIISMLDGIIGILFGAGGSETITQYVVATTFNVLGDFHSR
ncbi:hypothetical protein [Desulfosporosinus sp. SB140]|uniref:hypothetical protein n=1 Tax=Desulfosporosinus paludis TaxID=3115649 RepID=UPI00388D0520